MSTSPNSTQSPLRLACINIERSMHLQRVQKFVRDNNPDVLCLQELMAHDVPLFEDLMGQKLTYAPMTVHHNNGDPDISGVAMVARQPLQNVSIFYYKGDPTQIPTYAHTGKGATELPDTSTINHAVIAATVQGFRIATTHLTWTVKGASTPEQLHDTARMLQFADQQAQQHGGLVLCGDMNAPRGNPTFSLMAQHFLDAIPPEVKGSLDLTLHRVGRENPAEAERMKTLMVDALFHTPNYKLAEVKFTPGVSDHMALSALLTQA